MKRIIYKNLDNTIAIIVPSEEALAKYTYKEIAEKDCPAGLEYVIVNTDVIPTDRTFRECWELEPNTIFDGVGSESNEFPEEDII
jgi:hypothetical protein